MKYELTNGTLEVRGVVCHQVRALEDNPRYGVKKGDLGGFVLDATSLSQEGDCWVAERAIIIGGHVKGDALVYGDALVCDFAEISGEATVGGNTEVKGFAKICGKANVHGTVCRYADVFVDGRYIEATRDAERVASYHHIIIKDNAVLTDDTDISGNVIVCGNAVIGNKTHLYGDVTIGRSVFKGGNTYVYRADVYDRWNKCIRKLAIIVPPDTVTKTVQIKVDTTANAAV